MGHWPVGLPPQPTALKGRARLMAVFPAARASALDSDGHTSTANGVGGARCARDTATARSTSW
eukprot:7213653-Pyramimonas_sp.AAC.1